MTRPRLLIVIPTYNRASFLRLLLDTLTVELAGLAGRVEVLIADNCSPDETPVVIQAFQAAVPGTRMVRHDTNVGPDENFCRCVELADADHFWMMGDDDLPRAGAVRYVLDLIERQSPDLIYLRSDWSTRLDDNDPSHPVLAKAPLSLDRLAFARRVHVWTTFISGWVVRRSAFVDGAGPSALRRHAKTNLVQLAWILGTLEQGGNFLYVPETLVLATTANTGGYAVLKVFGDNFTTIVGQRFGAGSDIARAMVRRCALGYLPALLWSLRFGQIGDFAQEDPVASLQVPLADYGVAYRLLVAIGRTARPLARLAFLATKVLSRALDAKDRAAEVLVGRRRLA